MHETVWSLKSTNATTLFRKKVIFLNLQHNKTITAVFITTKYSKYTLPLARLVKKLQTTHNNKVRKRYAEHLIYHVA